MATDLTIALRLVAEYAATLDDGDPHAAWARDQAVQLDDERRRYILIGDQVRRAEHFDFVRIDYWSDDVRAEFGEFVRCEVERQFGPCTPVVDEDVCAGCGVPLCVCPENTAARDA